MDGAAASELEWQRKGRCAGVATKRAAGRCSICWRPIGCVSCTWRRVHERAGARSSPARPAAAATARPAKTHGSGRPGSPALQRAEAVRPNLRDYWQVNNHCRTCNPGYYMHGHHCKARPQVGSFVQDGSPRDAFLAVPGRLTAARAGGTGFAPPASPRTSARCARASSRDLCNSDPVAQLPPSWTLFFPTPPMSPQQNDHCGTCDGGHILRGKRCQAPQETHLGEWFVLAPERKG